MADKGWQNKGDKVPRRSPRKRGKKCNRPFKAPRPVVQERDSDVQEIEVETVLDSESQVVIISETQNRRDIRGKAEAEPDVIPYIKGIKLMSAREADECATHGEVLRWSTDSDNENVTDKTDDISPASDTTEGTPDIFKSPEMTDKRVPGSIITDRIEGYDIQSKRQASLTEKIPKLKKFKGYVWVPETELQEETIDKIDNMTVENLEIPTKTGSLTLEQIRDCKDGPEGQKAIGKTVAKMFEDVKFTGIIDSFRKERNRYIYHVTYSDGDEEEWCQRELRDGYVLGLGTEIETEWTKLKETRKDEDVEEKVLDLEEAASDGEGSLYASSSEEETKRPKVKRRKVVNVKRAPKKLKLKDAIELSGIILPQVGDKSVAGEAFGKLTAQQKSMVAANVNKKTKKV